MTCDECKVIRAKKAQAHSEEWTVSSMLVRENKRLFAVIIVLLILWFITLSAFFVQHSELCVMKDAMVTSNTAEIVPTKKAASSLKVQANNVSRKIHIKRKDGVMA